jgi:CBS domain-containing protein
MSTPKPDGPAPPEGIVLRDAVHGLAETAPWLGMPLQALVQHRPITLPWHASVLEVAQTMRDHGVSSVLLVHEGHLKGLVTDRDLRNRVVASGLDLSGPAAQIATLRLCS